MTAPTFALIIGALGVALWGALFIAAIALKHNPEGTRPEKDEQSHSGGRQ